MTESNVTKMKQKEQQEATHKSAISALLAAQANFGAVKKDAQNTHFKNTYATLHSLMEAVLPALQAEGLVLSQPVIGTDLGYFVRTILHHPESGTELQTDVPLLMGKQDMQQLKSASTYARRIGLENLAGVASTDDDDAETDRKGNPMGAALKDAWRQSVEDSLPENSTPLQRAQAYAKAICEDFDGKGEKALRNRWEKHKSLIQTFEQRFPDLHEKVVDAYENSVMAATGQD